MNNICFSKECSTRIISKTDSIDIKTLKNKAVNAINQLLDIEKIDMIIYVDDKFDIDGQKEEFIAKAKELKNNNATLKNKLFDGLDLQGPDQAIKKFWDESSNKEELVIAIYKEGEIVEEQVGNLIPALEVSDILRTTVTPLTPDEWMKEGYDLIKNLEPNKLAICLFDFEFQKGNSSVVGKNGVDLASKILEDPDLKNKVICGIFSSKFNETDEDSIREEYAKEYHLDKNSFYTISKFRYYNDPKIAGFTEGIKNLLLLRHVETLKQESLKILNSSNQNASKVISNITPKTFNQIVQKSSLKEGIWEVSTMFRLYNLISKKENYNSIADKEQRAVFNDSIAKIRKIDLIETGYNSGVENAQLTKLRDDELYLDKHIMNKLHLPISNGDIFKINNKHYILLVQPCNLAIRAGKNDTGLRSKGYNNAFLVPIHQYNKNEKSHTKREIFSTSNTDSLTNFAYFPEFKVLPLEYLDLTVFNENGIASIDMNVSKLDNDLIHAPWLKRYEYIFTKISKYEEKIQSIHQIKDIIRNEIKLLNNEIREATANLNSKSQEEKNNIIESITPLKNKQKDLKNSLKHIEEKIYTIENFDSFGLNTATSYDNQARIFTFDITRIKHYKSPYSNDLLQHFMLYLSRNAFDHDFTV